MPGYWAKKSAEKTLRKKKVDLAHFLRYAPLMNHDPPKFGHTIPEMKETIARYGCRLRDKPLFVLVGQYDSLVSGPIVGILAAASNEFHAHLLRKEFRKRGTCDIERSEFHPDGATFSIEIYRQKVREKIERYRKEHS